MCVVVKEVTESSATARDVNGWRAGDVNWLLQVPGSSVAVDFGIHSLDVLIRADTRWTAIWSDKI